MSNPYKPPESELGPSHEMGGIEFEFHIGDNLIVAQGSLGSGNERIYINNDLASEKKTFSRYSSHEINVDGKDYRVIFSVRNPFSNKIECELLSDSHSIKKMRCEVKPKKSIFYITLLTLLVFITILAFLKSHFQLPDEIDYIKYIGIGVAFVCASFFSAKHGEKIITDVSPNK